MRYGTGDLADADNWSALIYQITVGCLKDGRANPPSRSAVKYLVGSNTWDFPIGKVSVQRSSIPAICRVFNERRISECFRRKCTRIPHTDEFFKLFGGECEDDGDHRSRARTPHLPVRNHLVYHDQPGDPQVWGTACSPPRIPMLVMSAVDRKYYGVASEINGTMRLLGQMLSMGIAVISLRS